MKKRKKRISKGEALLLVIIGLFLGTVFTFGNQYWNADVKQSDAIKKEAIFDSYKETFGKRHSTKGIYVYFFDCDQLYIDATCVNEKVRADLNNIESGTGVTLVIHPNSDTILDMRIGEYVILEFDNTMDKIKKEMLLDYLINKNDQKSVRKYTFLLLIMSILCVIIHL